MLSAPENLKRINRFEHVSIPESRVLFERYGFRAGTGFYTSAGEPTSAMPTAVGSTISQLVKVEDSFKPIEK